MSILRRALAVVAGVVTVVLLCACTQTPPATILHSMRASGSTAFVCMDSDHKTYRIEDCPDYVAFQRHLYGLVTQTETDEVAVVDVTGGANSAGVLSAPQVIDDDPSTPGYSFLRVGARPGAIVSTPGGAATFVAVSGLRKNGIFALPSTCIGEPSPGQPARDVTTWPACSLDSAPGDMAVLIEPETGPGLAGCAGFDPPSTDYRTSGCTARLDEEVGPKGRRLLAVALPAEERIVLIDAQSLLNRQPGDFQACPLQGSLPLSHDVPPAPTELLPPDLSASASCAPGAARDPVGSSSFPAGFALAPSGDRLYVADLALPMIHVLDVDQPCSMAEQAPLLTTSYLDSTRVVTTSRLAVSPVTPSGEQFLYAVDNQDLPASVMAFDVSAGSSNSTPLVFPGAPRQPSSPPDRIQFTVPVRDVAFALRDFPSPDPNTGVGSFGTLCDPNPNHPANTGGTAHEPNPPDFTSGARPGDLRGVFGFAMLTNGQIGVIDVADFDEPCRRPQTVNTAAVENFQGCAGDDRSASCVGGVCFSRGLTPTVTGESSCRMVEEHRARSVYVSVSSQTNGLHAPSLRAFPQFANPNPGAQPTAAERPQLLGVNFPNPVGQASTLNDLLPLPAQVNVGLTQYSASPAAGQSQLDINPTTAAQASLVLPLNEPRSYAFDDTFSLTYEGKLINGRRTGVLSLDGKHVFDADAGFCTAGVQDATQIGAELGTAIATPAWASDHADYVQITSDFPAAGYTTSYWDNAGCSHDECEAVYGKADDPLALNEARELRIDVAHFDHLDVSCRVPGTCRPELLNCCFPAGMTYSVRASHQWLLASAAFGVQHDIGVDPADASGLCVHRASCDPRRKLLRSRAFEVCDTNAVPPDPTDMTKQHDEWCGCRHDYNVGPVEPNQPGVPAALSAGSECIFEGLTSRFALYRGRGHSDSARDMSFLWQVTGGFAPLAMSLGALSSDVDPRGLVYVPRLDMLAVTDGAALGLSIFSLDTLGVISPSPFF